MLRRRQHCLGALAIALTLAAPGPSHAQDPQVDPDSPAGTEYQLPLDHARQQAGGGVDGGTGTDAGGTAGAAPLFGAGVESEAQPAGAEGAKSPRKGTDSDPATTASVEADGTGGTSAAVVRAQAPSPEGGGGDFLAVGAGAGGVLLLGGLAGLAWRRRSVRP